MSIKGEQVQHGDKDDRTTNQFQLFVLNKATDSSCSVDLISMQGPR
ncbi:MAG: hypothetical protein R3C11_22675 [Planctomycetaceae bacterium]